GVDGKRNVGKSCLINKFASDDFDNGQYKNAFHAYVTTTHIRLDDYDLKIEFLETVNNRFKLQYLQFMESFMQFEQDFSPNKKKLNLRNIGYPQNFRVIFLPIVPATYTRQSPNFS
ncbi:20275_t:CDS:2, partial [Gigaspora rosea]